MEMMNTHRDTTTMYEQCKRVKAMSSFPRTLTVFGLMHFRSATEAFLHSGSVYVCRNKDKNHNRVL